MKQKIIQRLFDMDMVCNIGLMELIMKASGHTIKQRGKEPSGMQRVTSIEENLKTIWQMVMVSTPILMVQSIRVNLEMMSKKDTVKKNG